jgi:hypothetical protein
MCLGESIENDSLQTFSYIMYVLNALRIISYSKRSKKPVHQDIKSPLRQESCNVNMGGHDSGAFSYLSTAWWEEEYTKQASFTLLYFP